LQIQWFLSIPDILEAGVWEFNRRIKADLFGLRWAAP
jgi:hypothetical protein